MIRFGVLGWPVAHSRSPAMHRAAYRALDLRDHHYQLLPAPPEVFEDTVRALAPRGFRGANVTIPHKEAALALAGEATDDARAIGAANTLTFRDDGVIHAANTDAPGLLAALPSSPEGATALVLGAGGSARAAVYALLHAGAAEVLVWNRTGARAEALARELGATAVVAPRGADLLVNCTSVGLSVGTFKDLPIPAEMLERYATVADLVYRDGGTALISEAVGRGCAVVDGLEILVHQGALSFEAWTGLAAPVDAMREGARGGHPDPHDARQPISPPASAPDGRRPGA
jgi:shikimate dehydrogenase